jgi:hypothetical protein
MFVAAAVLPQLPALMPALGRGDDDVLDDLRRRATDVVSAALALPADLCFVVGADTGPRATSFAPWGPGAGDGLAVDVPEPLPLPVLIGAAFTRGRRRSFVAVDPTLPPQDCVVLGAELAAAADRVTLLLPADGAARHSAAAPGYLDPRAVGYDEAAHAAFANGDPSGLAAIDPGLADELLATGRAAWQVLAGAAGSRPLRADASWAAPYGVGYHFVTWIDQSAGQESPVG